MMLMSQPAGHYPDEPVDDIMIQMNWAGSCRGRFDVGAGVFEGAVPKNQFVVVPPRTRTDLTLYDKHTVTGLGLPTTYLDAALIDARQTNNIFERLSAGVSSDPIIPRLLRDAWREARREHGAPELFIDSTMLAIAARLIGISQLGPSISTKRYALNDTTMACIAEYVDSNVDTAIRIKTLAALANLTEYEFARQFRTKTGLPPYQWLIEKRLDKASQLLSRTKLSLADIAYACGFSSQAHMTTTFRRKRHVTPLHIRNGNR